MVVNDRCKVISGEEIRFEQDRIRREGCMRVTQSAKNEVRLWFSARWEDRVLGVLTART